jgi:hypothetical protein
MVIGSVTGVSHASADMAVSADGAAVSTATRCDKYIGNGVLGDWLACVSKSGRTRY